MNRLFLSALALAIAAPGAFAWGHPSEEWLSLDREIESLSAAVQPLQDGEKKGYSVSGWIRTSYNNSSDFQTSDGDDLGGVVFDGIRVNFKGSVGGYDLKVSIDGRKGTVELKDAYVRFALGETFHAQVGRFKSRFLFSSYASDEKLVLFRRSILGQAYRERDEGVQVDGKFGPFLGIVSAQNGGDGVGDKWVFTVKGIFAILGKAIEKQSGGYGPDADTALTLGLGYLDDTSEDDSQAVIAEGMLATGPFWLHGEFMDEGEGFTTITRGVAKNAGIFSDASPWNVTAAFMVNEHIELAGRYQDFGDDNDSSAVTPGVTYYVNGHATKWQLNYVMTDSDDPGLNGDILIFGLTVIV